MQHAKLHWRRVPRRVRRPVVLVIGGLVVLASGLIGWLPGPGGIPVFLLGIAILASEFAWADRLKQWVLQLVRDSSAELKKHPWQGALGLGIGLAISCTITYFLFFR